MEEFAFDSLAASIVLLFVAPLKHFLLPLGTLAWATLTSRDLAMLLWLGTASIWVKESTRISSGTIWEVSAVCYWFLRKILAWLLILQLWIRHSILVATHIILHLIWHLAWNLIWHLYLSWNASTLSLLIDLLYRVEELAFPWTLEASSGLVQMRALLLLSILVVSLWEPASTSSI